MREAALAYLYKVLKKARIAQGQAEVRPGITPEELENIQRKIDVLEWIIPLVIKAEEEEHAQDD